MSQIERTLLPSLRRESAGLRHDLIICLSHLRWNFVYQRPQHLMGRAAKNSDVFFLEEPIWGDTDAPRLDCRLEPEGVTVCTPMVPHWTSCEDAVKAQRSLLDELLAGAPALKLTLWYYTPAAVAFTRHLRPAFVVYDCMDELSAFRFASSDLAELERELFARADLAFTGGRSLYEAKRPHHRNVHCFPSSIDKAHFQKARDYRGPEPQDQAELGRPRIGYFGVIDERMDLALVAALADERPDWQLVMIGPTAKIDPESLPQRTNIAWLGPKPYAELPAYLAGWDAGFMPFALNEATRFISPTKTPEFLAAGLPLISTRIADVVRPYGDLGLVEIANSAGEMAAAISDRCLSRWREPWLRRVDAFLGDMSWDRTWSAMRDLMQKRDFNPLQTRQLAMGPLSVSAEARLHV